MMRELWFGVVVGAIAACSSTTGPPGPPSGVVYTFPANGQIDVPLGARIVVTFSDPVNASAIAACSGTAAQPVGALCLVGPDGPVAANAVVAGDGRIVQLTAVLAEGTTYAVYARPELAPAAGNLPASGPLVRFTTRSTRPRTAATALLSVNGGPPDQPEVFRPMFESSTIRLVFSQPLDPRSVALAPGRIELVDASGAAVPARLLSDGIHVSIDPVDDLVADESYQLRIGSGLTDLAGRPVTPASVPLTPNHSAAKAPIIEMLRTRAAGDHGPAAPHVAATRNAIAIDSPLIGTTALAMQPGALAIELADPTLLDRTLPDRMISDRLAFTIRRGQRLRAGGLDVQLGGVVPAGLHTGDILIELLSDGGGRIYRNPYQPVEQRPDNNRSPLLVDLSLDLAIYAVDPEGNAVLTQTVLGVQGSGVVIADDGVLDIEAAIAIDLDLLGLATTTTNLALELITDPTATRDADGTAPTLLAALPGDTAAPLSLDTAVELVFSEPIDLEKARAGGIQLQTAAGQPVPAAIESHGAALALHPLSPLLAGTTYRVALTDIADLAGNALAATAPPSFTTPPQIALPTDPAPRPTLVSVHPGAPCALTAASTATPGHCLTGTSGKPDDKPSDDYHPFSLAANDAIDVRFTQALAPDSVTRGTACDTGSVRIEEVSGGGCVAPVAGTLRLRDRTVSFIPDRPWQIGKHYRLTLVSGRDASCDANELCGTNGVAVDLSPLDRDPITLELARANLLIDFTGAAATTETLATMETAPVGDVNGSGTIESGEPTSDDNRVALRITGTAGQVRAASFQVPDCIAATPEADACMALSAALPVTLLPAAHNCQISEKITAASCVPVALSPQLVIATSLPLLATVVVASIPTVINPNTGALVMRLREPAGGPAMGYIVDDHGTPTFVATLKLYLDGPDMLLPNFDHDLHAKELSIDVRGPLRFLPDGRIAIAVANLAEVQIDVNIHGGNVAGAVQMMMPVGGLKLQLVSPPLRGGAR